MKILVVGSGAREHALAAAIRRSPLCDLLYAAPGNPGIAAVATCVPIAATAVDELVAFARDQRIDLVVVGPDAPLALGLVDKLEGAGIRAFGPTQAAGRLEASKAFTKELCRKAGISTAESEVFTRPGVAKAYIRTRSLPIVIKADGLAAGKGVTVARSLAEADAAIDECLEAGRFGDAGACLLVEDFLEGEEASFFALVDGTRVLPFGSAQDHKAAYDGDQGPNTGGMGAYAPAPVVTREVESRILREIVEPAVAAMHQAGTPFRGVLFAGVMIDKGKPSLIEFNARFGDPECEVLMALLESDLLPLLDAVARGDLSGHSPVWRETPAMCVVLASKGYPGDFAKGSALGDLAAAEAMPGVTVYHAGTALDDAGRLVSAGGRVLTVTAAGNTLAEARERAYAAIEAIGWNDGFCRGDIGWRALGTVRAA